LLAQPGTDVPVTTLRAPRGDLAVSRRLGADPVLDDRAKARYRDRLAELDEEIDGALGRHDDDRAAELDHERQALIDGLRRATGLAGRSRRLGDDGERARKTVTALPCKWHTGPSSRAYAPQPVGRMMSMWPARGWQGDGRPGASATPWHMAKQSTSAGFHVREEWA
jgi:hypothetical protein